MLVYVNPTHAAVAALTFPLLHRSEAAASPARARMIVTPAVGRIQTHDIPLRGLLIIF